MAIGYERNTIARTRRSGSILKKEGNAGEEQHADAHALQRSFGNQTIGRWTALQQQQQQAGQASQHPQAAYAARDLRGVYAAIVIKYANAADAEHAREWRRFSRMTTGQRQAVLVEMAGSAEHLERLQNEPLDWKGLQESMDMVEGVRLQPNEPEQEGNVWESGLERSSVNVTGLLEPYRELVIWLNYKANKQGKAALMQRFELMSIPQKKIALHKMVPMRKLRFRTFADSMTVTFQLKQWVDWEKMTKAMSEVEKVELDESDEEAVEKYLETIVEDRDEDRDEAIRDDAEYEEEKEEDDELDSLFPIAMTQDAVQNKKKPASTDFRELLQQPHYLLWLLFGVKEFSVLQQQKQTKAVGVPDDIVDRFLNVNTSSPKERAAARKKQLQQFGFQSMRQCYIYLLMSIVTHLYEWGVVKKEQEFTAIIDLLGLFNKRSAPTKEQITQKLRNTPL